MIDLRKRVFSMLGQKERFRKIDIIKHFPKCFLRRWSYVSPVRKEFIIKVCLPKNQIQNNISRKFT